MTISHIGLDQHVATIKFTFFEPTLMIYIALSFWDMDIDIISGFGVGYGI